MDAFFQRPAGGGSCGYDWLLISRQMKPSVQRHLKMVYLTLCSSLVASAIGFYLHILFNVGGIITMFGCFLGSVILILTSSYNKRKMFGFLMVTTIFKGASIGTRFEPRITLIGFVGTCLTFACFSRAAMMLKHRKFLYWCGKFSIRLILFLLLTTLLIYGPNAAMINFEIYLRLLIFLGDIVFDTQEIIEMAHHGDLDYVKHAFTLFSNFSSVLVHILAS